MKKDVIIACDFPGIEECYEFIGRFGPHRPFVKIGMELYYSAGPKVVSDLKSRGHPVFLDLKLHDIPNTVRRSMAVLARLGVDMVNLHAAGGREMMRAAVEGLEEGAGGERPLLLAVTILTSISKARMNDELYIPGEVEAVVQSWAALAEVAGLDGVVCSPLEAGSVKQRCGEDFITVTPGIRYPEEGAADDQSRVTTPADAAAIGSDFIVVGRPITAAEDPLAAWQRVRADFLGDAADD